MVTIIALCSLKFNLIKIIIFKETILINLNTTKIYIFVLIIMLILYHFQNFLYTIILEKDYYSLNF